MRSTLFLLVAVSCFVACGGEPPPPPKTAKPAPTARPHRAAPTIAPRAMPSGGSSDGMTCDEAREKHGDEIAIGKKGEADLSSDDFAKILNDGKFLGECEVATDVQVDLCTAIKSGRALGVTVALSPSDPEKEKCVAGKVREIGFPMSKKLDVVRTRFLVPIPQCRRAQATSEEALTSHPPRLGRLGGLSIHHKSGEFAARFRQGGPAARSPGCGLGHPGLERPFQNVRSGAPRAAALGTPG